MIFWGCSKRISSKAVIGSWWSLQEDSTYFEVYINEEQFVFNHESYGPIYYEYLLVNDSLFISDRQKSSVKKWKIVEISDSKLVFKSDWGEIDLHIIPLEKTFFEIQYDSIGFVNFQEEFIKRYLEKS